MRTPRPFTTAEIKLICERYSTEGTKNLARELGRDKNVLQQKAKSLGLRCVLRRRMEWTAEQDRVIREQWPRVSRRERTAQSLADQLRVPDHQVRIRAAQLGVSIPRCPFRPWSTEETDILSEYAHLGLWGLQKRLKRSGWVRSKNSIAAKLMSLNIHTRGENIDVYSAKGLAELLGINQGIVMNWIVKGWLTARPRTEGQTPQGTPKEWAIRPKHVRQFIREYTAHVDFSRADKFWLVDLLTGRIA